jgi:acid stress-induced BolA-like protein IbaG/YrbA
MQETIVERVAEAFPGAEIKVELDGNRALIEVVSAHFSGLSRVKKQQSVYACIQDFIADGSLHAVTIKAIELDA